MQKFTEPLAILQCKLGDSLHFTVEEQSPYNPQLTVKSIAGVVLYGPVSEDIVRNGYLHWTIDAGTPFGLETAKTYYTVEVDDTSPGGYTKSTWCVYVNDSATLEDLITRAQGLAGHNCRKYNHTWTRGQLTSYYLKIYASKAALETADAGGSDVYIANYLVTIKYDSSYNPYEITSVKQ